MNSMAKEDITVFITRREGTCADCGRELFKGNWIRLENEQPLCLECADLGHLEFLPRGDTALTRRATKYSPLRAVVVQWSRSRKRYERQGILVAPAAMLRAEEECLADADIRERRRERAAQTREAQEPVFLASVITSIRAEFPGCPAEEAEQIAAWTCEKHSGRVGRSAAAKQLDPHAVRLAVVAHIRHQHTSYDELLMSHGDRRLARSEVYADIGRVLRQWEAPAGSAGRPGMELRP
jgi:hypothetical protein